MNVRSGLDIVESAWPRELRGARVGLLAHPSSVTSGLIHATDVFIRSRIFEVTALFGPQHGIRGETQDNMIEWEGFCDPATGLSVYS
ncbi:MAG: exo-beta-N-acetylmuramidase NamZ domain-containing protein, partial [Thermodesulfovibrionales bacterium]